MGRKRNTEERSRIETIAFGLFKDNGYGSTSLQDIARAAGIGKSLVQHYFPRKEELLRQLMKKSLKAMEKIVEDSGFAGKDNAFQKLYLIGCLGFEYLIRSQSMYHLKYDILCSRDHTAMMIDIISAWNIELLHTEEKMMQKKIEDALTIVLGGAFEYVYKNMGDADALDTNYLMNVFALQMNMLLGVPAPECRNLPAVPQEWIARQTEELNRQLFGTGL